MTFVSNMDGSNKRIVILGKTGTGKSSLANIIFGEELFETNDSPNSETSECQAKTKSVNGRNITLIDTPGFFDTNTSEEELKTEIVRCITECSPGPHAFLIVLKVEKYTEHEQAVVKQIQQHFSEEVFKYTYVVFTHGDQLRKGETIEDFVSKSTPLSDLVQKCGRRCHVIDNKYWNENPKSEYRSNQFQVEDLLKSIDEMVIENNGSCYTNEMLQEVEEEIQQEEENIRQSSPNMSKEEVRKQAKARVFKRFLIRLAGTGTGVLLGALLGVGVMVGAVLKIIISVPALAKTGATAVRAFVASRRGAAAAAGGATAAEGAAAAAAAAAGLGAAEVTGIVLGTVAGTSAVVGAVKGGIAGYKATDEADTVWEATKKAAVAVKDEAISVLDNVQNALDDLSQTEGNHYQRL